MNSRRLAISFPGALMPSGIFRPFLSFFALGHHARSRAFTSIPVAIVRLIGEPPSKCYSDANILIF